MPSIPASNGIDHVTEQPFALRHIPFTFDNSRPEKSTLELIRQFCPRWKNDEETQWDFVRFTEGITNTLIKAVRKEPEKTKLETDRKAILLRAYGQGTDVLIDRERELRAHQLLATMGLAPSLLARFENGLMYRFTPGDVCSPIDLRRPEVYRQVAKRLGQWHASLPVSALITNSSSTDHPEIGRDASQPARPTPNNWIVMQRWIDALPSKSDKDRDRKNILGAELQEVVAKLGDAPGLGGKDYIFGHCDLLSGNVIVTPRPGGDYKSNCNTSAERPVDFIDYEYATPASAAFDLANHFSEWAGFDCDHSAIPTRSQRREFLQHYVASFRLHVSSDNLQTINADFEKDIDHIFKQVDHFRGIPGFFWGVWALIQAQISQIDFDYAGYAELRLSEYWECKSEMDGSRAREGRQMSVREKRWAQDS